VTAFWRLSADGAVLAVKAQPKSRRPGVQGVAPGPDGAALRVGVSEPAEDGRANQAICDLLANRLAVPRSAVTIAAGHASRTKRVAVAGDPTALAARLEAL
jgi:uncharacterized protein YggU (UPF0235/DUF167 family)